MAGISISMTCPNCGGSLSVAEGANVTSCPYCTALLAIEGDDGIRTIMFRNKISRDRAIESMRRWWHDDLKARDLKRRGRITESFLIYVPFWNLKARAAGWMCGSGETTYTGNDGKRHTVSVPLEEMIARDFDWSEIACDPGDIGVEQMHNLEGEALLHEEGIIPTFEPTTSHSDAMAKGIRQITSEAIAYTGVSRVTFKDMHVFPKSMGIIFYPLWVVRYTYFDRMYFATIDGVTGMVLSGRAPGDSLWRSLTMVVGMAVGGIGTALSIWLGLYDRSLGGIIVGGIVIVSCLSIAAGTLSYFRYGSEITTGDVKGGYNIVKGGYNTDDSPAAGADEHVRYSPGEPDDDNPGRLLSGVFRQLDDLSEDGQI